ncbi:MAG TPA: tRNA (adenosine(37)-N6)-threonylcarbamoyltransferase complex transferase subunit TsaD [Patescibacteria group bacterium]|nr:tRNA (adenosine(37)-N6)-threonylcarbamoyltransferase complex transferase subunit TsaD [Patescibacteria group bacterium]
MKILAIDTSCDDTSVAVADGTTILSNVISSQTDLHKQWGGVVPILAKRRHQENIDPAIKAALQKAKVTINDIDGVAVTYGPGLAIALEVGVEKAKQLAAENKKPLLAVNHMIGHIYANLASTEKTSSPEIIFPALALLASGGHTELVLMLEHGRFEVIGEKLDDAAGEAFDKVARMLGLGYPGGALLAKMAEHGNNTAFAFPVPLHHIKDLNFSYSGIKAAVQREIKKITDDGKTILTKKNIEDLAASFQHIAIQHMLERTERAIKLYPVRTLLLGGGVSANLLLRKRLRMLCKKNNVIFSYPKNAKLCMDNAAMIAVAASFMMKRGEVVKQVDLLDRNPVARIGDDVAWL